MLNAAQSVIVPDMVQAVAAWSEIDKFVRDAVALDVPLYALVSCADTSVPCDPDTPAYLYAG